MDLERALNPEISVFIRRHKGAHTQRSRPCEGDRDWSYAATNSPGMARAAKARRGMEECAPSRHSDFRLWPPEL